MTLSVLEYECISLQCLAIVSCIILSTELNTKVQEKGTSNSEEGSATEGN